MDLFLVYAYQDEEYACGAGVIPRGACRPTVVVYDSPSPVSFVPFGRPLAIHSPMMMPMTAPASAPRGPDTKMPKSGPGFESG